MELTSRCSRTQLMSPIRQDTVLQTSITRDVEQPFSLEVIPPDGFAANVQGEIQLSGEIELNTLTPNAVVEQIPSTPSSPFVLVTDGPIPVYEDEGTQMDLPKFSSTQVLTGWPPGHQ
ncbi:uncharacterized protein [Dysidea avara]